MSIRLLAFIFAFLGIVVVPIEVQADIIFEFRFETTRLNGSPVQSLQVGEDFLFNVYTEDLRFRFPGDSLGVFAGYLDVDYNGNLTDIIGPVVYGPLFQGDQDNSNLTVDGLMDNIGNFATNGNATQGMIGEILLLSVPLRTTSIGTLSFSGRSTGNSDLGPLLYETVTITPNSQVDFGATMLNIAPIDGMGADPEFFDKTRK